MPLRRIESDPDMADLERLIQETIGARIESARLLGEGCYGILWDVTLSQAPRRVVVKWQKRPGRGIVEKKQLETLREHSIVPVPEVLGYHPETEELPFEALVMEYIAGAPASSLPLPDRKVQTRLAHRIIDALEHWHFVANPEGYGPIGGPYCRRWLDFYGPRLQDYLREVRLAQKGANPVSPVVRRVAEESYALADTIVGHIEGDAVLIHSDFWLPNIMLNPDDYSITGVIDPLDAEWAHRELDLIHLDLSGGNELGLLELYEERHPPADGYTLRRAFYKFWYAMQNYARIGWYDENESVRLATALEEAIRLHLQK